MVVPFETLLACLVHFVGTAALGSRYGGSPSSFSFPSRGSITSTGIRVASVQLAARDTHRSCQQLGAYLPLCVFATNSDAVSDPNDQSHGGRNGSFDSGGCFFCAAAAESFFT